MSQVTYNDKIGIIDKETHENQWWDDDANEIKDAINDTDNKVNLISQGSGNEIANVSALWTGTGLNYNVTANNFPVNNIYYSATPGVVTLDTADATNDRIDLIVAIAPCSWRALDEQSILILHIPHFYGLVICHQA